MLPSIDFFNTAKELEANYQVKQSLNDSTTHRLRFNLLFVDTVRNEIKYLLTYLITISHIHLWYKVEHIQDKITMQHVAYLRTFSSMK